MGCGGSREVPQRNPQGNGQAQTQTPDQGLTFVSPDPWPSDAALSAAKAHMAQSAARNPDRFRAVMRMAAFESAKPWLIVNFPRSFLVESGIPTPPGPVVVDGVPLPSEDMRLYVMKLNDNSAEMGRPATLEAVKLVINPPLGADGAVRLPVAGEHLESAPMKAGLESLLAILRIMDSRGMQVEGCMAIVVVGVDMQIFRFYRAKGFEDLPEGTKFVTEPVNMG